MDCFIYDTDLRQERVRDQSKRKAIVSRLFVHGHLPYSSLSVIFYRTRIDYYLKILEN